MAGAIVDDGLVQFDYSGSATLPGAFSGGGSAEVVAGTLVVTSAGAIGGAVTIDNGATMQWGAGNPAFLIGGSGGVVDNGALVLNFGGGGVGGTIPISGTGTFELVSGSLNNAGASTYTGTTTIDAAGLLLLSGAGSIADSSNVIDNGAFDISGTTGGASIVTLSGSGGVSLGGQTLTLTHASGTFSGVLADGGLSGGTGGKLTIAAGTETLSGVNTYTGLTTIDLGATLDLVDAGSIADSGDPLVNGTFDISGVSGGGTSVVSLSGAGHVILGANTLTLSHAADLFSGFISGTGGLTLAGGTEILTGVNTFTGTTLIDTGATLQLGNGAGVGLLAGPITDNGLLLFDGGAGSDTIYATAITGSGALTLETGILGLTGTNTYAGPTTVDTGATLQLGAGGTTGTVAGGIADNGLVQFNYSGSVTTPNTIFGTGSAEVVAGTLVVTAASAIGGTVTVDNGATMQWGAGNAAFLVGGGEALVDNGALVLDFGGGGVAGAIPISGTGSVTLQSGVFQDSGASTYTGITTIDASGVFRLSGAGSIADSAEVFDNGVFDISGTTAGTAITTLSGAGVFRWAFPDPDADQCVGHVLRRAGRRRCVRRDRRRPHHRGWDGDAHRDQHLHRRHDDRPRRDVEAGQRRDDRHGGRRYLRQRPRAVRLLGLGDTTRRLLWNRLGGGRRGHIGGDRRQRARRDGDDRQRRHDAMGRRQCGVPGWRRRCGGRQRRAGHELWRRGRRRRDPDLRDRDRRRAVRRVQRQRRQHLHRRHHDRRRRDAGAGGRRLDRRFREPGRQRQVRHLRCDCWRVDHQSDGRRRRLAGRPEADADGRVRDLLRCAGGRRHIGRDRRGADHRVRNRDAHRDQHLHRRYHHRPRRDAEAGRRRGDRHAGGRRLRQRPGAVRLLGPGDTAGRLLRDRLGGGRGRHAGGDISQRARRHGDDRQRRDHAVGPAMRRSWLAAAMP